MGFWATLKKWIFGTKEITLHDGSTTRDPRLDRVYELDWRSLNYPVAKMVTVEELRTPRSYTWACNLWLNQGSEGACVGFGCSHELAARPVPVTGLTHNYAREKVYWEAQKIDPWTGGAYPGASPFYEGTSVLAGVKILTNYKFYTSYYWALNIQELVVGVGHKGPAILGFDWYEGMMGTDSNGWIRPTGQLVGGHCILAIGVKIVWKTASRTWNDIDLDKSYLLLHNSWGQWWGDNGRAKLSLRHAEQLLNAQGDAAFPIRNPNLKAITV